ncbi:hypothetical protein [Paenibacillus sp. PL91]|uniref:hypothetical protein n=1 Tax=Paenibacillus sp. PL91 TaxID=2729538 RepID=UPI001CB9A002|nr:hypothetical protein [Paenibacillus sp. PL91]
MNCRVRVQMRNGECFEGVIVNVDNDNVYLRRADGVRASGWFGFGFGAGIFALSLFALLAIALI